MKRLPPATRLPLILLALPLLVAGSARAELRLALADSIPLPPGEVTGLCWAGRDTLAVLVATDAGAGSRPAVVLAALDRMGGVYWQADFSGVLARGLAWDGERFWSCGDDREGGSLLYKVDPAGPEVVAAYPLAGHRPTALAFDGRWLWVADRDLARIDRLEPENGQATRSVNAPGFSPGGLAWDGGSFWVADAGTGLLLRLRGSRLEQRLAVAAADWFARGGDTLLCHDGRHLWILAPGSSALRRALLD
jgi:sugar lactone lactonase YvrE